MKSENRSRLFRFIRLLLKVGVAFGFTLGVVCLAYYVYQARKRPALTPLQQPLYEGIVYERRVLTEPRPVLIHIVTLDLTTPSLRFMVTPPDRTTLTDSTNARTTTQFVDQFGAQLAINASFFYPFYQNTPLSYYPHVGDAVTTLGPTISDGVLYSADDDQMRTVCIIGRNVTLERGGCPADTEQAVGGNALFVRDGRSAVRDGKLLNQPYSRTTMALDKSGETLWIVIVDGKQPRYSEGLTLSESAELLINLGADRAINLDGGGSVTLAMQTPEGAQVLNAPIHARIPMWERPIANHIGIFAQPIAE